MNTRYGFGLCAALMLAGCAAEAPTAFPYFDQGQTITLSAGQSVILARGQRAKAPFGVTVIEPGPGGSTVILKGQKNTVNARPGVIVTVPTDATGPADNFVVVK
jgi:hypothetical protein